MRTPEETAHKITDELFHLPLGTDQDHAGAWLEKAIAAALREARFAAFEEAAKVAENHINGWRNASLEHIRKMELELGDKYREMIFIVEPIVRQIRALASQKENR